MVPDWSNHIGPIKAQTTTAKIILEVVVELKRLAALQRHCTIKTPAVLEAPHASAHIRQFVAENPGEAMGHIEVRWAVFQIRPGAVIGLCCVRLKVLTIAGIVQRLRPRVVHNRSDSMPTVNPQTGLQCVVI